MKFSSSFLLIPFFLQVVIMGVDELYFHQRRKLARWERLGHPLDTLTVLLCFGWIIFMAPSSQTIIVYVGLSIFSSLFITKDEKIHQQVCSIGEHWLHAVLFILHPLILLSAGLLWPALHQQSISFIAYSGLERNFFLGTFLLTFLFGSYQFLYWNFIWRPASTNK